MSKNQRMAILIMMQGYVESNSGTTHQQKRHRNHHHLAVVLDVHSGSAKDNQGHDDNYQAGYVQGIDK